MIVNIRSMPSHSSELVFSVPPFGCAVYGAPRLKNHRGVRVWWVSSHVVVSPGFAGGDVTDYAGASPPFNGSGIGQPTVRWSGIGY